VTKDERRKWKNVNNVEGWKKYRKLRNLLAGDEEKAKNNAVTTYKAR